MSFVKLDCGILDSSLWASPPEVRLTFLTMLAMAQADGLCRSTAPGIARRANLPLDDVRRALAVLEGPDADSRDKTDGKRVERVEGGYQVLNYTHYREYDFTAAARMKKYREKKKLRVTTVTPSASVSASTSASVLLEGGAGGRSDDDRVESQKSFEVFWGAWPEGKRKEKQLAMRVWAEMRPTRDLAGKIIAAVDRMKREDDEWARGFIPRPHKWLEAARWEEEPAKAPEKPRDSNPNRPQPPSTSEDFQKTKEEKPW